MEYRKAVLQDIPVLMELRKKQLVDEGIAPDKDIDKELAVFFENHLRDHSLVEWLVIENDTVIATAAIVFYDFPPTYTNKSGMKGYITNMYTAPDFRGRGIATYLLEKLCAEARSRKIEKLWLGASRLGRPVYLNFGFQETDEWLELNVADSRKGLWRTIHSHPNLI